MASLKLVYGSETRRVSKAPGNIEELCARIRDLFGLDRPKLLYRDEDNDLITIQTDEEYLDALKFSQGTLKLILYESSVYHNFLTQSSVVSPPELQTGFTSNKLSENRYTLSNAVLQDSKTEETKNVENRPCSTQVVTSEVAMNTHNNQDISIAKQIIDLSESSSDTAKFESKLLLTKPVENYSISTAAHPIEVSSKESYTELTFEKSLLTDEKMKDSMIQYDILPNQDSELMNSIRFIIREELDEIRRSISNQTVFQGTECKNCSMSPVVGSMYICSICDNYTICEACEEKSTHPHFFIKLKTQTHQSHFQARKKRIPEAERIEGDQPIHKLQDDKVYKSIVKEKSNLPADVIRISQNSSKLKLSGQIESSRPTCLDITILLDKMHEMGLRDKAVNISAIIKSGYQLEKAIDLALEDL